LRPGKHTLLMGFGVGLSWAGCVWTETWATEQAQVQTAHKKADTPAEPRQTSETGEDSDDAREAA
jgi:hypothetical protein